MNSPMTLAVWSGFKLYRNLDRCDWLILIQSVAAVPTLPYIRWVWFSAHIAEHGKSQKLYLSLTLAVN